MKGAFFGEDECEVSIRSVMQERVKSAKIEYSAASAELEEAIAERDVGQKEEEIAGLRSQHAENFEGIANAELEIALLAASGSTGSGSVYGLQNAVILVQRNSADADTFLRHASIETARAKS